MKELVELAGTLLPAAFVAVTWNAYAAPTVRPVTVQVDKPLAAVAVQVRPPGDDVTV